MEALAKEANLGLANTSQHLKALRQARLVGSGEVRPVCHLQASRRGCLPVLPIPEGHWLKADSPKSARLLAGSWQVAMVSPGVDREQLLAKVREGSVTVIDVRPREEYRAGHLSGALSIPLKDLKDRLRDLPADRNIIAYCRGPYCVLAIEAVEMLNAHGLTAFRLESGPADWQAVGTFHSGWRRERACRTAIGGTWTMTLPLEVGR